MSNDQDEYRDYAQETFDAVSGCTTPDQLRRALWYAGLHVGRRPDTEVGQDWRVGLVRALSTSEDEEACWVVSETMPISLALLDDVRARERIAELEGAIRDLPCECMFQGDACPRCALLVDVDPAR